MAPCPCARPRTHDAHAQHHPTRPRVCIGRISSPQTHARATTVRMGHSPAHAFHTPTRLPPRSRTRLAMPKPSSHPTATLANTSPSSQTRRNGMVSRASPIAYDTRLPFESTRLPFESARLPFESTRLPLESTRVSHLNWRRLPLGSKPLWKHRHIKACSAIKRIGKAP